MVIVGVSVIVGVIVLVFVIVYVSVIVGERVKLLVMVGVKVMVELGVNVACGVVPQFDIPYLIKRLLVLSATNQFVPSPQTPSVSFELGIATTP